MIELRIRNTIDILKVSVLSILQKTAKWQNCCTNQSNIIKNNDVSRVILFLTS